MVKEKILIACAHKADANRLESLLANQGYEVVYFSDISNTPLIVVKEQIDLLIIDGELMSAADFAPIKSLRQNSVTRFLPIIVIIPVNDSEQRKRGIEAGCDDFISKPFDENDILIRTSTLLKISACRPLLNEKWKFDYVLNNINDGMIVFDNTLRIAHINEKARTLLAIGHSRETSDFIKHVEEHFDVQYNGNLKADLTSRALLFDVERPATGTAKKLILLFRTSVVKNPLGEITNIVILLHDVTEERLRDAVKQNFLDLISHKLRTPLTVITEGASLLEEKLPGPLNAKQKEIVVNITEKSHILGSLIEKLLGFSTIYSKQLTLTKEPIVLYDRITALVDALTARIRNKKFSVTIHCDNDASIVYMRQDHFDLIINNLLENSVKFNDKEVARIAVSAVKERDMVRLSVSDNGPGIPAEENEKVFAKFYQIEKEFTGNVEGAGLGLALAQYLINAYGGSIQLKSELDKGATFTLIFSAISDS